MRRDPGTSSLEDADDDSPDEPLAKPSLSRRKMLQRLGAVAALTVAGSYPFLEAKWCRVNRVRVPVRGLPRAFGGLTIALVSDIHHGPFVPMTYVRHVAAMTRALEPDLVLFGGDYVHTGHGWAIPCLEAWADVRGKIGTFGVLGNHDQFAMTPETREGFRRAGILELRNDGTWIRRAGERLRIAGVGDLVADVQDLPAALGDAREEDCCILLSHEPDYVEQIADQRVGLVLSGHTHGGQVRVPWLGAPIIPSHYGRKYAEGLVQGPSVPVFITRGIGTIVPPVRLNCRPEIALLELVPKEA